MAILDHDDATEVYVDARRLTALISDLQSLADSWNSLAVTHRLMPTGFWARAFDYDRMQSTEVLEQSASQLLAAIRRFEERL